MEVITISGILTENCEKKTDKKGNSYIRFKVLCKSTDMFGKPKLTIYRCYCYNTQFDNLKQDDIVFLTGKFNINMYNDKLNLDIYVQQLSRGDCQDL